MVRVDIALEEIISLEDYNFFRPLENLLRRQIGALLHHRADRKEEAVDEREIVFEHILALLARVRILPLVGRQPPDHKQDCAHADVGAEQIDPDLAVEGRHEGEEGCHFGRRLLEQNRDASVHERQREVDRLRPFRGDCQVHHGDVSLLLQDFT